jgi:polysaccharide biosynthesis transport protein
MTEPRSNARAGQRLLPGPAGAGRPDHDGVGAPIAPLNPRELLRILRRHMMLILFVTTVSTAGAIYWTVTHAQFYSASAVVRLNNAQRSMTGGLADGPMDVLSGTQIDPVLSLVEVLQSRTVAGQVVDSMPELRLRLDGVGRGDLKGLRYDTEQKVDSITLRFRPRSVLYRRAKYIRSVPYGSVVAADGIRFRVDAKPDADAATMAVRSRESAIQGLLSRLRVQPRNNTDVVDVTYRDYDPELAQRVANRVVQTFQVASAERGKQTSVRRREFLQEQLHYQDSVLGVARLALVNFRSREQAFSARARIASQQQDLSGLEVRREELTSQRQIVHGLLNRLGQPGVDASDGLGALLAIPDIAANPTIQQLFNQLVRYQGLRDSLTMGKWGNRPNHPDVIRADQLIAGTHAQLLTAFRGLETSLDSRIASLEALRRQNSVSFPELSASEGEETDLEEQVETSRRTVEQLRSEYERARLTEAVGVGEVEVIDVAPVPTVADGVPPTVQVVFGFLLGLLLGGAGACVLEFLNTSIRRRDQVAQVLQLSELAVIPPLPPIKRPRLRPGDPRRRLAPTALSHTLVMQLDRHSVAAEAYRLLRTNLIFSDANRPPRTITVTSASPGEGKTVTAANLAVAFAQQGIGALLIDADLRRGRLHELFRVPQGPGLTQVLQGRSTLEEVTRPSGQQGLSIVTTGPLPADPGELLTSELMAEVLEQAARLHGVVIIDTGPLLAVSDASVIASRTDATVLVVRAGQTKEDEAKIAMAQLVAVGANVVGVVLNDRDAEMNRYGDVYYGKYYASDAANGGGT